MSDLSVNDHLEGILSDFEALKRSFDIDDVDDIPTFSPTSPLNSPFSPSPSSLILTKTNEGRGPTAHVQPTYQSRISISSSLAPSPVMKNKVVSSLSFNRGSIAKTNGNTGSSITRVSSFQTKFNPNGFSSSCGPGSDNDSLYSSTSSLEYQASSKLGSYASPPQSPMGMSDFKAQRICSPALNKFSSHGNMFHSEVQPPLVLPAEPMGANHGSMPSLDLHITESRGAGNARSPSMGYRSTGPTWNAASLRQNARPLGREPCFTSGTQSPKPKEPTKLNKFPLDLDNLVVRPQEAPKEAFPRPAPRSHSKLSSPTSSTSPAVSISSLDTVATGNHSKTAIQPPGCFQVPSVSESPVPLSPPQTPQFRLVSQPQVVQLSPVAQTPAAQVKVTQKPQINKELAQGPPLQKENVGSILQRIASFSRADNTGPRPRENKYHGNKQEREEPPGQREAEQRAKTLEAEKSMAEPQSKPDPDPKTEATVTGLDLFGYVGIESVLDQMRRKAMKTGFEFNIMVVGQSGLGKSTLVNTLFKSKVSRKSCSPSFEEGISKTVNLQSISHVIEEKGVKMKLTVIDTPGFGDQINNLNCWEPIMKYINEQYEKYLKEEININRKRKIPDTRVHCCIYFVPPTGHCLRPLDLEFMKRLGKVVSVVPVIAKSDTLTLDERQRFKERIRQDLWTNGIKVYPQKEYDEDAEDRILNDKIREKIPFAVVGTDKEHQVNGKNVLGRKTKWGVIEVENVAHCEFANLRDLLIRSHLQDLKDVTHNIHYETYRVRRLNESNLNGIGLSASPLASVNGTVVRKESESNL
ncbi:septin-9 isoform X1 [Acipenser oxyrinchus oxyrinchus]|uniref:Septin-9 isoform X1 n=1 Tax=Acipenser oxyrinchus oxyrinchus TaxID=40147 RepID=A0AAD8D574_ACIOX|nr:septin-9 isoform X1 [Acipenser oxyrinchus oxyrinchus]